MDDIYCSKIIPGLLKVEVVYESDLVLVFENTRPYWEHHVVIIPKEHIESLSSIPDNPMLKLDFFDAIENVVRLFEKNYGACRISSNVGTYQTSKHLHWYVHAGQKLQNP